MTIYKQVLAKQDWFYIEYIRCLHGMEIFSIGYYFGFIIVAIIGFIIVTIIG